MSFWKDSKNKLWALLPSVYIYKGYKYMQTIMQTDQIMSIHKKSQHPICWSKKEESNLKIRIFNSI